MQKDFIIAVVLWAARFWECPWADPFLISGMDCMNYVSESGKIPTAYSSGEEMPCRRRHRPFPIKTDG